MSENVNASSSVNSDSGEKEREPEDVPSSSLEEVSTNASIVPTTGTPSTWVNETPSPSVYYSYSESMRQQRVVYSYLIFYDIDVQLEDVLSYVNSSSAETLTRLIKRDYAEVPEEEEVGVKVTTTQVSPYSTDNAFGQGYFSTAFYIIIQISTPATSPYFPSISNDTNIIISPSHLTQYATLILQDWDYPAVYISPYRYNWSLIMILSTSHNSSTISYYRSHGKVIHPDKIQIFEQTVMDFLNHVFYVTKRPLEVLNVTAKYFLFHDSDKILQDQKKSTTSGKRYRGPREPRLETDPEQSLSHRIPSDRLLSSNESTADEEASSFLHVYLEVSVTHFIQKRFIDVTNETQSILKYHEQNNTTFISSLTLNNNNKSFYMVTDMVDIIAQPETLEDGKPPPNYYNRNYSDGMGILIGFTFLFCLMVGIAIGTSLKRFCLAREKRKIHPFSGSIPQEI